MRVLATAYKWRLPRRNRELRVPIDLIGLCREYPDLTMNPILAPICILAGNGVYAIDYLLQKMAPRWGLRKTQRYFHLTHSTILPSPDALAKDFDIVFAHESFPWNAARCPLPIVVQTKMMTDECRAVYGISPEQTALERAAKGFWVQHAASVIVPTPGDKQRLSAFLEFPAEKCLVIPPYLPWLTPVREDHVVRKQAASGTINILFVGNEAQRKGINEFTAAWRKLAPPLRERMDVVVLSRFVDGVPDLHGLPWEVRSDIAQREVERLFREAHVLILPTHADTFGNVLVEGMAAGCCVISSLRSPQDWILDSGRAGILVEPRLPDSIAAALESILDSGLRLRLALNGHRRYCTVFDRKITGRQYHSEFRRVLDRSGNRTSHECASRKSL